MDIKVEVLLILLTLSRTLGWRPFTVEFQNITYEILRPDIIYANITIKNNTYYDLYTDILKDVSHPFVDFVLLHDSGNGVFDMVYTNKTVDGCLFLKNRNSNVFFNIVYKILSDYIEMPKRCPILRKHYEVKNAILDAENFPPFLPDHKAHASVTAWTPQNGKKNIVFKSELNIIIERTYKRSRKG